MNTTLFLSTLLEAGEEAAEAAHEAHAAGGPTFPMFLGVLFGAMSVAALLTWLSARGGDHGHH